MLTQRAWEFLERDCGMGSLDRLFSQIARLKTILDCHIPPDYKDIILMSANEFDKLLDNSAQPEGRKDALYAAYCLVYRACEVVKLQLPENFLNLYIADLSADELMLKRSLLSLEGALGNIWEKHER